MSNSPAKFEFTMDIVPSAFSAQCCECRMVTVVPSCESHRVSATPYIFDLSTKLPQECITLEYDQIKSFPQWTSIPFAAKHGGEGSEKWVHYLITWQNIPVKKLKLQNGKWKKEKVETETSQSPMMYDVDGRREALEIHMISALGLVIWLFRRQGNWLGLRILAKDMWHVKGLSRRW